MKWAIEERDLIFTLYMGRKELKKNNVLSKLNTKYNISFATSEAMTGALNEVNITITGLEKSKMFFLATSTTAWTSNYILNQLTIEAGYKDKTSLIFDGEIIEAIPDLSTSDYKLTIKAVSYFSKMNNDIMSLSYDGNVNVVSICSEIAQRLGFALIHYLTKDYVIENYTLQDASPFQHLRYIAQVTGLNIYVNKNRVYIVEVGKSINPKTSLIIDDSIMIGSPKPTQLGCDVTVRMSPQIVSGQKVEIKSLKFPQINSNQYVVEFISHDGETKGSKWQTNLSLIRSDIYEQ